MQRFFTFFVNFFGPILHFIARPATLGVSIGAVVILPVVFILHVLNIYPIPSLTTGDVVSFGVVTLCSAFILYYWSRKHLEEKFFSGKEYLFAGIIVLSFWLMLSARKLGIDFREWDILLIIMAVGVSELIMMVIHAFKVGNEKSVEAVLKKLKDELHLQNTYRFLLVSLLVMLVGDLCMRNAQPVHVVFFVAICIIAWLNKADPYVSSSVSFVQSLSDKDAKKRPVITLLLVLFLTAAGSILRLTHLDQQSYHADEFNQISAIEGYVRTGDLVQWDFVNDSVIKPYKRSPLYTKIVAESVKKYGLNEFGTRLPGAIVSSASILMLFFFVQKFFSTRTALWSTAAYTFYPMAIYFSRYTRNYSMSIPFYLLLIYAGYALLENGIKAIRAYQQKNSFVRPLMYTILWIVVFAAAFLWSYDMNVLTINVLPAYGLAAMWFVLTEFRKELPMKKTIGVLVAGALLGIAFLALNYFQVLTFINVKIILEEHINFSVILNPRNYMGITFSVFTFAALNVLLFFFGIVRILVEKNSKQTFFLIVSVIPLLMAIYLWNRYLAARYIYLFTPLLLVLSMKGMSGVTALIRHSAPKLRKWFISPVILITAITLLVLPITIPGVYFPPLLQRAQANWSGDDAARVNTRGVDAEWKKAFSYVNANWKEGDALVTTLRQFAPIYFTPDTATEAQIYNLVRDTEEVYLINTSENCTGFTHEVVDLRDLEKMHNRVWIVADNMHWWKTGATKYLLKNAKNFGDEVGIKTYQYNGFYENKPLTWPSLFLLNAEENENTAIGELSYCNPY